MSKRLKIAEKMALESNITFSQWGFLKSWKSAFSISGDKDLDNFFLKGRRNRCTLDLLLETEDKLEEGKEEVSEDEGEASSLLK